MFDGTTWRQITGGGPPGRAGHAMASLGAHVVLFGGYINTSLQYLAEDCAYRYTETAPVDKGHAAIAKRLASFSDAADKVELKVLSTFAAGPIVTNHPIDHLTSKTKPLLFEGVGVFFLKNGKIKEWTDYTIRAVLANEWPKATKT